MYFDTPPTSSAASTSRSSTATSRSAGTSSGARRPSGARHASRSPSTRTSGTGPIAWSSASAASSATGSRSGSSSCSGTWTRAKPVRPLLLPERQRIAREGAHEAVRPGAPRARRPQPADHRPRPVRAADPCDRPRRRHVVAPLHRGARATRARVLRLRHQPRLHRRRLALRAVGGRHQAHRRGGDDDRGAVPAARGRDRPRRRAREGAQLRQGAVRAPAREPARDDHVRAAPRSARGSRGGAAGDPRSARRRHRRGRAARRQGDPRLRLPSRRDRPVRRRRPVRRSCSAVSRRGPGRRRASATASRACSIAASFPGSRSRTSSARSNASSACSCSPASKSSQPRLFNSGPSQYAAASEDSASSMPRFVQATNPARSGAASAHM